MKPVLAVTMGDPAGVGAEICVKALTNPAVFDRAQPMVVGSQACLQRAAEQTGINAKLQVIHGVEELDAGLPGVLQIWEPVDFDASQLQMGAVSAACGEAAVQYFEHAVRDALAGRIQGVVTCPINKEAVHAAGYHGDIGHQEILARMTSAGLTATMLMTTGLKVAHLSTHKSLAEAVRYVTRDVVVSKLALTHQHLLDWMGRQPRIALAALNPHGGEGGMLGREEIDELHPAVEICRARGLDVTGPLPADSVFYRAVNGEFDAVMALYHDQGHIAIKVHNFEESITATMGIPFIRTSVDHGTAFDIAGQNRADATGLVKAIDAAIDMMNGTLS
ncbi:MAG: 4-hydroxythreonine-4-phosphate dehydrogenase PdxA [Pseudomonadales bacterium]|nr:4-hydroxythreonine-4-phosphate dehydrogenase PdxA [Pseudomonadales bacterium]